MMEYVSKLEKLASEIEAKRGPFTLFGLFMREDSPGQWDLVLSAPWLERGKLKALGDFVRTLETVIGQEAVLSFSRIVTLNRDEPPLRAILDEVGEASVPLSKQGHNLFGLPIEEAYILRARPDKPRKRIQRRSTKQRIPGWKLEMR